MMLLQCICSEVSLVLGEIYMFAELKETWYYGNSAFLRSLHKGRTLMLHYFL
jgi:hypothetical protein